LLKHPHCLTYKTKLWSNSGSGNNKKQKRVFLVAAFVSQKLSKKIAL
jgi:hypothetical protein